MSDMVVDRNGVNYPQWQAIGGCPAPNGRSTIDIRCGICGTVSRTTKWSIAGTGKRCHGCGGLHHRFGYTVPKVEASHA